MGDITSNPEAHLTSMLQKNPDQMGMNTILLILSTSAQMISSGCVSAVYDACVKGKMPYEFGQVYRTTKQAPSFSQFKAIVGRLTTDHASGVKFSGAERIEIAFCLYAVACALGVQEFIGAIYAATGEPFDAQAIKSVNGYTFDNRQIIPRLVNALHEHGERVVDAAQALLDEGISPVDISMLYYTDPTHCPFVVRNVTVKSIEISPRPGKTFAVLQRRT